MNMPNELNKRKDRYIFLYGITIPFFDILLNDIHFGKNATPV